MDDWLLIGAKGGVTPPRHLVEAALTAAPPAVIAAQSTVMPRKRDGSERCRICGVNEPMTREHVPPRAAGNDATSHTYGIMEWLARESLDDVPGGKQQQGGNWGYTLCGPCNNTTGRYAPEYALWADAAAHMMMTKLQPAEIYDAETVSRWFGIKFPDAAAGSFVRQVLSMMMTASSEWGLAKRYPNLRDAVLTGAATTFPDDLFLGVGLSFGPTAMTAGPSHRLDLANESWRWSSVVVHPPFAFEIVLAESDNCEFPNLCGIGPLVEADERQRCALELELPLVFTHTGFPADWRTRAQIEGGLDIYGHPDQ